MRREWRPTKLGDHVDLLTGFPFQSKHYTEDPSGIALLRGDNIAQGTLRWEGVRRWPRSELATHQEYQLQTNDVVLAMDRPWIEAGLKYAALSSSDLPALLVQRVARLRGGPDLDTGYLRYLIGSQAFTDHVLAVQTGTAVPHISSDQIKSFQFDLPPISIQRDAATALQALDERIDLNRKTNRSLEAVGRAIFSSWFVDFDPVRRKASGLQPVGVPTAAVATFPSRFEESGGHCVPEGWTETTLERVLAVIETGGRPKGGISSYSAGIPSIGAESIQGLANFDFSKTRYVPHDYYESMNKGRLQDRDVLLYKDGGRPGQFEPHVAMFGDGFPFQEAAINEHVYRLRTNDLYSQVLLYFWLTSESCMDEMRNKGTGVAVPGLNSTAVKSLRVICPPGPIVKAFDALVGPLIASALNNANQSRTLSALRDTLLPKFMSGEICVKQVKEIVEVRA